MSIVDWFDSPVVISLNSPAKELLSAVSKSAVVLIQEEAAKYYAYKTENLRIKPWFAKMRRKQAGKVQDYFESHPEALAGVFLAGQEAPADSCWLVETDKHDVPVRAGFRGDLAPQLSIGDLGNSSLRGGATKVEAPMDANAIASTVSIVRYPSVLAPANLSAGAEVDFVIDLPSAPPDGVRDPDILSISGLPANWEKVEIVAEIASASIEFKIPRGSVWLNRDGTSIAATIHGTVSPSTAAGKPITIFVQFFFEDRACGFTRQAFNAVDSSLAPTSAPLGIDFEAEPPTLTVSIFQIDPERPGRLFWSMLVRPGLEVPGLPERMKEEVNLGGNPADYIREQFAALASLTPGKHMAAFYGFGETLWRRSPDAFKQCYWAVRKALNDSFTIQFISDDANIPWEMMRPIPANEDIETELLLMTHPVARCIGASQGSLRYRLPSGTIATIAPKYQKANDRLERAQIETELLQKKYSAKPVNGIHDDVWKLLTEGLGPSTVSILHFAGHGDFSLEDPYQSLLKLQDVDLTAREVDTLEVKLGKKTGCLVFFNACKVGSTGGLLGGVGGWAEIILRRRFGGFIAPLWSVEDDAAGTVTADLFENLVSRKIPVSQALLAIRKNYGRKSPTYLAYLFYGDVGAKIQ